jgi:hypothetical protein
MKSPSLIYLGRIDFQKPSEFLFTISISQNLSAFFSNGVTNFDTLWKLASKTIVSWSQYLCQERRNVEDRQMVGADLRLH